MQSVRDFSMYQPLKKRKARVRKSIFSAGATSFKRGGIVETQALKWYNSRMKGGHPCDEFSQPGIP